MSIKSRTIDNLGIEASRDYAKRQKDLDLRFIEESRTFPSRIEGGATPYLSLEFDPRLSLGYPTVWANFAPPPEFSIVASGIFSYQMIPSLGGTEKLQTQIDVVDNLGKTLPADRKQQYEHQTVSIFLKFVFESSRTFDLIKARCNQFQRG